MVPLLFSALARTGTMPSSRISSPREPTSTGPATSSGSRLTIACSSGHDQVVSTLLAYGADVTPYLNRCPIQIAIDKGHHSCAELIRSWPALCNQNTAKLCIDKLKKQGYYDVVRRTADNDLPKHLFVFRVVEMMKMCGMESLAEHLIGFVGTSPDCACGQCVQGGGGI